MGSGGEGGAVTRDEALATALFAALSAVPGPTLRRGGALTEDIGPEGLVNMVDGAPQELEERLGGAREMAVEHEIEIGVAVADDTARAAALDALVAALAAAVLADAPLAALADHVRVHPLRDRADIGQPGAAAIRTATLPVELLYETGVNPLEA